MTTTTKEHSILQELPEMTDRIHAIKQSNVHFARLSDKYDETEHSIHLLQTSGEPFTDEQMEELKKKRLLIRDELYGILQKTA